MHELLKRKLALVAQPLLQHCLEPLSKQQRMELNDAVTRNIWRVLHFTYYDLRVLVQNKQTKWPTWHVCLHGLIDNVNWVETIAGVKTFDLEFMEWDDQIRYTGNFYDASAKREVSTFLKGSNRRQTHRQFLKKQFTLRANGLIQYLVDRLDMYGGFSVVVRVSNYEASNAKHYTDRGVIIEEATCEYTWQLSRQLAVVTLTLSDRYDREAGRC